MLTPSTADTSAARRRCERGRPWRGAGAPPALRDPRQRHGPPARPRRAAPPPHAPLPITAPRPEPRERAAGALWPPSGGSEARCRVSAAPRRGLPRGSEEQRRVSGGPGPCEQPVK